MAYRRKIQPDRWNSLIAPLYPMDFALAARRQPSGAPAAWITQAAGVKRQSQRRRNVKEEGYINAALCFHSL